MTWFAKLFEEFLFPISPEVLNALLIVFSFGIPAFLPLMLLMDADRRTHADTMRAFQLDFSKLRSKNVNLILTILVVACICLASVYFLAYSSSFNWTPWQEDTHKLLAWLSFSAALYLSMATLLVFSTALTFRPTFRAGFMFLVGFLGMLEVAFALNSPFLTEWVENMSCETLKNTYSVCSEQ